NDDGTPHHLADCAIHATLTDGIVRHIHDDLFWRKDGSSFRVEYVTAPMRDSDGQITGVVIVFHDVTREREMQRQVEQAIRVSSLGRIAASVAHEFNNVLMSILPFAEILMRKVGNDAALQRPLKHIMDAARRGKLISHQILRFVNPASPTMVPFDAAAWLSDFAEEAGTIVRDRALEIVRSETLPVCADAPQLAQVMTNLLTNARDATPANTVLTLGAARADTLPFVARQIENAERFAAFFVRDRGSGIPGHVLERIFEPLFTTKKSGGTGLGLAVAFQIVSEHGGKILIETAPGAGSTFYITLPLQEP
ncbi:MAG TPA: ATP-binding protein, partial [Thermoanaerobaculia bacterium]